MEINSPKPHAIMIPYPLQGHVIPFVHLALKLASHGFTITFVTTHYIHRQISTAQSQAQHPARPNSISNHPRDHDGDMFSDARSSGLDIRYTTVSDGFPLGFDRSLNHDQFFAGVLHVFSAHVDDLVGKITRAADPPVTCLISDTFYVWLSMICNKYDLVNVSFWTEPALVLNLYYHMDLLMTNGHFGSVSKDNRKDMINYIPGIHAIDPKDLMSYLQETDTATVVHQILFKAFTDVKKADFILCNTVQELEPKTISTLQERQLTYAIGPVFPSGLTETVVPTSFWAKSDCTSWLDQRPTGSVLYVSFGSYAHIGEKEIVEIAHGLMLSGLSFVWVLRPDIVGSDQPDVLPVGFVDQVKGKGLVVPWCCQMTLISHLAIGGFLTHCGWNSILESIWCSVPLSCYPLLTDQFTNRKLVVDDWRIGINLCDKKPVLREEVSMNINRLMTGETARELKYNIERVRRVLKDAISALGSSERNLKKFIGDIKCRTKQKLDVL